MKEGTELVRDKVRKLAKEQGGTDYVDAEKAVQKKNPEVITAKDTMSVSHEEEVF